MTGRINDPLSGLAPLLRVRPELQVLCRFGGAWSAPHQQDSGAHFHLVTRGRGFLELPRRRQLTLEAGDLLRRREIC
jgi:AraC family transcriptional activator of mtrCDE